MKSWLLAIRPKTLTAAFIPILVGTVLAQAFHQTTRLWMSLFALLSTLFIQIGTNLINDAADFKKGADTAERIGPKRVTQSGLLTSRQVLGGGVFCFALAILFALPLVLEGGWPIIWIGLFSLLAGYSYTAGPFPLAYLGLGDLFVLIFFGWVAVGGMYFLNTGHVDGPVWVAATQIGLLATVLIAINNLRDQKTDLKANKRTLPVRFGTRFARVEIGALSLVPFAGSVYWYAQGYFWASVLPLLLLPVAIGLVQKVVTTPPSEIYNQYLARAAVLHMGFGVLLSLGLAFKTYR